jgi:hypothetical protein
MSEGFHRALAITPPGCQASAPTSCAGQREAGQLASRNPRLAAFTASGYGRAGGRTVIRATADMWMILLSTLS